MKRVHNKQVSLEAVASTLVACPYSEDHTVPVRDLLLHLAKCRRLYYKRYNVKTDLRRCKYNSCHFIPAPEVMLHELTCQSQTVYQQCKDKMRCPSISLQLRDHSRERRDGMKSNVLPAAGNEDDVPNLIDFD